MSLCGHSVEIEFPDGTVEPLNCTMPLNHPEAHSCRVWWHNDDPERAEQDVPAAPAAAADAPQPEHLSECQGKPCGNLRCRCWCHSPDGAAPQSEPVIFADGSCQGHCLCEPDYECDYCGSQFRERVAAHNAEMDAGPSPAVLPETPGHDFTEGPCGGCWRCCRSAACCSAGEQR